MNKRTAARALALLRQGATIDEISRSLSVQSYQLALWMRTKPVRAARQTLAACARERFADDLRTLRAQALATLRELAIAGDGDLARRACVDLLTEAARPEHIAPPAARKSPQASGELLRQSLADIARANAQRLKGPTDET